MGYLSRRKALSLLGVSTVSLTGCASAEYILSDTPSETVEGCAEKPRGAPCVGIDYEPENPRVGDDVVFTTTVVDNPKSSTLFYFWDLDPRDDDYEVENPRAVTSYDEEGRYVANLVVSNRVDRDEKRFPNLGYGPIVPAFRTSITVNVSPLKQSTLNIENEQLTSSRA